MAYFLVAGSGAAIQFISSHFLIDYYSYEVTVAIAYLIAFFIGFGLTKLFAFDAKSSQKTRREMVKYFFVSSFAGGVMVAVAALTFNILTYYFPGEILSALKPMIDKPKELLGQIAGMGFSFLTNYVGHKSITFRSTGFYDQVKSYLQQHGV